jgi:hypothetical protein
VLANLKLARGSADGAGMYFCRQPPPERGPTALRSLHVSMNTPVVAIEDLAVGPARAAIAVEQTSGGRRSLVLALRSARTGQLACFAPDEALESEASAQIALDGALSFAESMGFLFDDDAIPELGADGPREAAATWNELLGLEPAAPEAQPQAGEMDEQDDLETDGDDDPQLEVDPEPSGSDGPPELWLEELAPAAAAPAPAAKPVVLLTKFRRTASPGRRSRRGGWSIRLLSHF